jgi:hypothetical protein
MDLSGYGMLLTSCCSLVFVAPAVTFVLYQAVLEICKMRFIPLSKDRKRAILVGLGIVIFLVTCVWVYLTYRNVSIM